MFTSPADTMDDKGMYCNDAIDKMLDTQSWVCPIRHNKPSDRAFYSPASDYIVVPMKKQFKRHRKQSEVYADGQEFYSTLIHEMVHSTGIESRLNRSMNGRFGSESTPRKSLWPNWEQHVSATN